MRFERCFICSQSSSKPLSVNSITENGGTVIFENDKVTVERNNRKMFEGFKNKNGLFIVNLTNTEFSLLGCEKIETIQTWHERLAHQNFE